jgi:hypothetical protein
VPLWSANARRYGLGPVALAVDSQRDWNASSLKCSLAPVLWWAYLVASACELSRAGAN